MTNLFLLEVDLRMDNQKNPVNKNNTKTTTYKPKTMDRIDRIFIPLIKSL